MATLRPPAPFLKKPKKIVYSSEKKAWTVYQTACVNIE